jgi:uncharacterized protein (TIRG00374 family)
MPWQIKSVAIPIMPVKSCPDYDNMNKKLFISFLLGAVLSGLTLYLAFRNVPIGALLAYLKTINYWWIGPTILLVLIAFALRALRWQIILKQTGEIKYWQAFHPLMIGFMMNCVLPGRIGEIARPVILKKNHEIPIATGLATVAAERVFDFFLLIGLLVLVSGSITSKPDLVVECFGVQLDSTKLMTAAWLMISSSIGLLGFLALIAIPWSRQLITYIVTSLTKPFSKGTPSANMIRRLTDFFIKLIDNFALGLDMVRDPARMLACVGLTIIIWGLAALSYMVFALGCPGIALNLIEWTTVMVVIMFFIALPSVPGFWGLWEAAGIFALALFGVAEKDALGVTLVNHAIQMLPVIVVGLASAWLTSVNILHLSIGDSALKKSQPNI